nr:premnaspirodiene oxygenase-like [Ipomoea batatas]
MHLQLGEISTVVISSPQLARAITKTHDLVFASRPNLMALDIVFYKSTDVVFSPYGDYWRQMRKICVLELLSRKMIKSFCSFRQEELSNLVSSIRLSETTGFPIINLTEKVSWFTSSVIAKVAFGRVCSDDQEKFIALLKEVLSLAGGFDVDDLFPSKKWIHYISGMKPKLLKLHHELDRIFDIIIGEHKENQQAKRNDSGTDEDIVDVLLRVKEGGELQFPITEDNIKAVINDMFSAGTETSATTIIWAMSEMIKRPSVMAKAQAEVRQALKGKKTFDDKDLENLTYLKLVIKETLRLHPPFPLILPRESTEEAKIGEYIIPPKTRVIINAWAIATNPESWEDPEIFLPERFENNSVDFMGNHYEFIPFGAGRRMCPGISFASTNIAHSLAGLLYHFNWELPDGVSPKDLDMTESIGVVQFKKEDLCLIARPFVDL